MSISTVMSAMRQGWAPVKRGASLKRFDCLAGCGRAVSHRVTDPTCDYLCPFCSQEASAFIGAEKKRKKAEGR